MARRRAKGFFPLIVVSLVFLTFTVSACQGSEQDEPESAVEERAMFDLGDPIDDPALAAIVSSEYGTDTLTADEFNVQIERVTQQFPQMAGDEAQAQELRRTLVEQFALTHALGGEVSEQGLEIDSVALQAQIDQIRERFESEEAFQQALAEQDLTEDVFRESMREQMEQQTWQQDVVDRAEPPSDEEVEAYREEQAEQVRVQHILFFSPQPDSAIRARAEAVLDTAKAEDVPFDELARRHSDDGTAAQGGDLDFFSRGDMVEPFSEVAFALQDSGDVADDVVRTQFGYHIIRLTGRRTGEPMPAEQAREAMLRRRQQDAVMDALDRLREKVSIRVNQDVVQADLNVAAE